MLVTGDLLVAPVAYLAAFAVRVLIPFPFTQDYLPPVRFAEVAHHWPEMLAAQLLVLYLLGLYDTRLALMLFHASFQTGFATLFMRNFIRELPDPVLDAARPIRRAAMATNADGSM